MADIFERLAAAPVADLLDRTPAVLLHGPRSAGKRTIAAMATVGYDYAFVDLTDPAVGASAAADPAGFLWDLPSPVVLEEIQRVPALLAAVGAEALRDPEPGRFLLTSTIRPDAVPDGIEAVRIDPLSQAELGGWDSGFLERLFDAGFEPGPAERLGFELFERVVDGGFADAVMLATPAARGDWYRDLVEEAVERDIGEGSRLRAPGVLVEVLRQAARTTGGLLNTASLAAPLDLTRPTAADYVRRLAVAGLVDLLPAWESAESTRLVTSPRLHVADTGIAAALHELTAETLAQDRSQLSPLLATFALQELRRQSVRDPAALSFSHLRDRDGAGVDIVVEHVTGAVAGICVRTGGTVSARDFRGLRRLRSLAGDGFAAGVVLYDGVSTVGFDTGLFAIPIRHLWELD